MDTVLYYTLSTIAQTLAGPLAILLAVVLFKLTGLKKIIDTAKETLASYSIEPARHWPLLRDHGFEGLMDRVESEPGNQGKRQNHHLRRDSQAAHAAYQDWGRINTRLYAALGFTVADIAGCFVGLSVVPRISASHCTTELVMFSAVILGIVCLLLYVWLITAMVRRPAD